MKVVVAAFNQEKALVGAFSVITNLRMQLFEALAGAQPRLHLLLPAGAGEPGGRQTRLLDQVLQLPRGRGRGGRGPPPGRHRQEGLEGGIKIFKVETRK